MSSHRGSVVRRTLPHLASSVAVFAVASLTLTFLTGPDGMMMPIWPGSAVALAFLWLGGLRLWPAVTFGLLLSAVVTGKYVMLPSVGIGSVLEGVLGIYLLRLVGFDASLRRIRDALLLTAVVTTAGPLLTAAITFTTTYLFTGPLASPDAPAMLPPGMTSVSFALLAARLTWVADALGTLLVAPTLLVWAPLFKRPWTLGGFTRV